MNRTSKKSRRERGYSLLEAVFAIAVLTVGAFSLLELCYSSFRMEGETVRRAECENVAAYACATVKSLCAREEHFLEDAAEKGAYPFDGSAVEYPADTKYRWKVKIKRNEDVPGLYDVTVLVFIGADSADEAKAALAFHTYLSERD
jgi:hypothetical protein